MECAHVNSVVALTNDEIDLLQPQLWSCAVCRSQKSPWLCLTCGIVCCGRYVNGHAKRHSEMNPGHCLCMDQGLRIFCYDHDEFVINDNEIIQKLRDHIDKSIKTKRCGGKLRGSPNSDTTSEEDCPPPPPAKMTKFSRATSLRTAGLQNLGNTCFMNSILQSLSNIEQFYCYFRTMPSAELKADSKKSHSYQTRSSNYDDVSLVEEIRKVLCALWDEDNSTLSPDSLFSVIWRLVPRFRGYQQQDAHEFMRYLLDRLHSELSQALTIVASPSDRSLMKSELDWGKSSIVSQIFGGTLQSDVTCLICRTESQKLDPILDLSLDIPDQICSKKKGERTVSISDCLSSYTTLEDLTEQEWYYCPRCKQRQPSTKRLSLHSLPNVLCLHLKRFRFNSFVRTKINCRVTFPSSDLQMAPYTSLRASKRDSFLYNLAAVVVHHGSGVGSGHYTTYAVNPKAGVWYHFNDSTVTEIDLSSVLKCKAYILFYIRREWRVEDGIGGAHFSSTSPSSSSCSSSHSH